MKQLLAGLAILEKYNSTADVHAVHDRIVVNIDKVSAEDAEALNKIPGWHFSKEDDCWAMFT